MLFPSTANIGDNMSSKSMVGYAGASSVTGLPKGTLRRMVHEGTIPHYRIGPRTVLFSTPELEEWLCEMRSAPTTRRVRGSRQR
jgi:excisionase family DNA binding protein